MPSFDELYAKWYPKAVELCRRTGCGDQEPEDVAQEAFLKAWAAWDRYRGNRPFWPWLSTIAKRLCVDQWRRASRDAQGQEWLGGLRELAFTRPDEAAEEAEEHHLVGVAMASLRPCERRVFSRLVIDGWSYHQIAEAERVSLESVRATLYRARGSLRELYLRTVEAKPAVAALLSAKVLWARAVAVAARLKRSGNATTMLERASAVVLSVATVAAAIVAGSSPGPSARNLAGNDGSTVPLPMDNASATSAEAAMPAAAGAVGGPHAAAPVVGAGAAAAAVGSASGGSDSADVPITRLPLDRGDSPEDGYVDQFATAPGNPSIVFASGSVANECELPNCAALFRSDNGGESWRRLAAVGYTGGQILLPPNYPADSRIFSAESTALTVSRDGGGSFEFLAPLRGPASISPAFNDGDPRILSSMAPGWEYRADVNQALPLTWGNQAGTLRSFTFAPNYPADDRVFVGGTALDGTNKDRSTVRVCRGSQCGPDAVLAGSEGTPGIVVSPTSPELVLAWRNTKLYRSVDGGTSFAEIPKPVYGFVHHAVFVGSRLYVAMTPSSDDNAGLFASDDGGTSWQRLGGGTVLDKGVSTVVSLGPGRLLAAPLPPKGNGVLCSADGGQTWAPRCPIAA